MATLSNKRCFEENEPLRTNNQATGFQWLVHANYEVRRGSDECLYPVGEAGKAYCPLDYRELPGEFAKLATGSQEAIGRFCWGSQDLTLP